MKQALGIRLEILSSVEEQLTMGDSVTVDFELLESALQDSFGERVAVKLYFVKSDATEFHTGHLKQKTLPMEATVDGFGTRILTPS